MALPALLLAGCGGNTATVLVNAPTANAGGPYAGVAGTAVSFNGSGSSDPQGETLTYAWSFGDGSSAAGAKPTHTYTTAGTFTVSLTVTDTSNLSGEATTTAAISVAMGNYSGTALSGKVLAGTTPVIGASVQLWAAGTTGNGSVPTQLLQTALTTDSNGAFSVSAGYTCPVATSILYIIASGGKAGASGASNASTVLMTVPGACNSIAANASYVVDEVTTVASAYALGQFLKVGAQMGATATNTSGITLAAATLASLVNLTTGTAPGTTFPATGTPPTAKINSLANVLHACIVSSGSSSTACSGLYALFTNTTVVPPPGNTLDSMVSLAKSPATGVSTIYNLSLASNAFTPALSAAPDDWVVYVTFGGGGMNAPSALALDSQGRVWVASYFSVASLFTNTGVPVLPGGITGNGLYESYGGAVDANDNFWQVDEEGGPTGDGEVTVFNSQGSNVTGSPYSSGGIYFPYAVAVDSANVSWVVDYGDSHVTLLSNSGAPQSGTSGYSGDINGNATLFFPVAIAIDSNRNGWLANFSSNTVAKLSADGTSATSYVCCDAPDGLAIDGSGNVWVANYYGDSVSLLTSQGTVLSAGFKGGGIVHPQGIAVDGAGNVWIANYRGPSISELAGAGSGSTAGTVLSPTAGWAPDANLLEAFALAIDASGNVWVTSFGSNTITEYVGLAAPVKTPLLGPVRVP
jgi:PKD repeat protein